MLLGAAEVRALAAQLDLKPTKQRGQNFVIDPNTVRRIVAEAGLSHHDVVVEVGPGLGSLTLGLLEVVDRVIAIEVDERLAKQLPLTLATYGSAEGGDGVGDSPEPALVDRAAERCVVIHADALRVTTLPGQQPTALVANLPYNVSVPVVLHLLATLPTLTRGLVMVQAEVADRLAAKPGSRTYGVPSVKVAWFADVRRAGAVGRNVFWPAPNVDSGLVAWTSQPPPDTSATRAQVFTVIDAAFAQRRKTLRAALKPLTGSTELSAAALTEAGLEPHVRGEQLDVDQFAHVAEALVRQGCVLVGRAQSKPSEGDSR